MQIISLIKALELTAHALDGFVSARDAETELLVAFGLVELWRKQGTTLDPIVRTAFECGALAAYATKETASVGLRVATALQLICLRIPNRDELKNEQALAAVCLRQVSNFLRTHGYAN